MALPSKSLPHPSGSQQSDRKKTGGGGDAERLRGITHRWMMGFARADMFCLPAALGAFLSGRKIRGIRFLVLAHMLRGLRKYCPVLDAE
ncbi:hypothetical protein NPIL_75581 [Nephila pilipes]|uniref:Uncharacterized protein n=1 Tax=Nephila pilipes TaxID=299642 RepID=A0A8X6MSH7_NEPPI|nr:hypothetical protein NPIL_75581 [Nephila pilipes]